MYGIHFSNIWHILESTTSTGHDLLGDLEVARGQPADPLTPPGRGHAASPRGFRRDDLLTTELAEEDFDGGMVESSPTGESEPDVVVAASPPFDLPVELA